MAVLKKIGVKLSPQLEAEGRGLCDPTEPINKEIITRFNYGPHGYMEVYASGFIRAKIAVGQLIAVKPPAGRRLPKTRGGPGRTRVARGAADSEKDSS